MKQPSNQRPPSLDDLFALKRAERPSQEFWDDFQREFHVRQRAAAIEPKRWWFVLPRIFVGLSRYQMPMGAAAVLAVTFLSFREYREPGFEVAFAPASPVATNQSTRELLAPESAQIAAVSDEISESQLVQNDDSIATQQVRVAVSSVDVAADPMPLSPMVVWAGVADRSPSKSVAEPSPSARSIAANLAAVRAEQPEIARLPGEPQINLTASAPSSEPLAGIAMSVGSAREPLFAYQPAGSQLSDDQDDADGPDIHSRIASRLSDDQLYESVRRLTAGGDRLTLKF
ncbi:hypothetical protein [Actomonas aquatica]|uniref:Uncharacterized protein n=1 Tax=Actomonas aquatica TaxID=2866162 RepID=A0ABZ1C4Z7_9BACT|nr:hypothetical protein [Opitutus sp. WL0086]WRQ86804.1 hypothetical protein K1X11_018485 [Opitutus sp. WL0086]